MGGLLILRIGFGPSRPGDWSLLNPDLEPSGWFFEYRNGFYPDIDDTAMVLMGLARGGHAWERPEVKAKDVHQHWTNGAAKHVNGTAASSAPGA